MPTRRVILESAIFHGPTIRNTARRLGLRSEASMRHEKGIAHDLPRCAADRAAAADRRDHRSAGGDGDRRQRPGATAATGGGRWTLPRVERLLGIAVDARGGRGACCAPLGFEVAPGTTATVAGHRARSSPGRHRGRGRGRGDRPQPRLRPRSRAACRRPRCRRSGPTPREPRASRPRASWPGWGWTRCVTHALIGPADLTRTGYDAADPNLVRRRQPAVPSSTAIMRPVPYPSMLAALAENVRQRRTDRGSSRSARRTGLSGRRGPAPAEPQAPALRRRGTSASALLGPRVPPGARVEPSRTRRRGRPEGHRGRAACGPRRPAAGVPPETAGGAASRTSTPAARRGSPTPPGAPTGSLGEVHPRVAEAWDLPGRPRDRGHQSRCSCCPLVPDEVRVSRCPPPSRSTATWRWSWTTATPVGELLRILRRARGPAAGRGSRLFDVYRGPQIGEGTVSYAIALRFQPETAGDERVRRACDEQAAGRPAAPPGGPDPLNGPPPRLCVAQGAATLRRPARPRPCGTPMSPGGRGGVHLRPAADRPVRRAVPGRRRLRRLHAGDDPHALNCVVVLVAFMIASQLRDPLYDVLGFWQAFTPELRRADRLTDPVRRPADRRLVPGALFWRRSRLPIAKSAGRDRRRRAGRALRRPVDHLLAGGAGHLLRHGARCGGRPGGAGPRTSTMAMNSSVLVDFFRTALIPTFGIMPQPVRAGRHRGPAGRPMTRRPWPRTDQRGRRGAHRRPLLVRSLGGWRSHPICWDASSSTTRRTAGSPAASSRSRPTWGRRTWPRTRRAAGPRATR